MTLVTYAADTDQRVRKNLKAQEKDRQEDNLFIDRSSIL